MATDEKNFKAQDDELTEDALNSVAGGAVKDPTIFNPDPGPSSPGPFNPFPPNRPGGPTIPDDLGNGGSGSSGIIPR